MGLLKNKETKNEGVKNKNTDKGENRGSHTHSSTFQSVE